MKKIFCFFLIFILAASLSGCSLLLDPYMFMTDAQIKKLPADERLLAISSRLDNIVLSESSMEAGFAKLSEQQKIVYAVNYYDMEWQNGGLCQFFINSSRMVAPDLSEYLEEIGAVDHQALYDAFVSDNHIDFSDMSEFDMPDTHAYEQLYKKYPFDAYDEAFGKLPPLTERLDAYIEAHWDDIL